MNVNSLNDMRLVETAAKAAGYGLARWSDDGRGLLLTGVQEPWNPLEDDGDALRLAVKLGIRVEPSPRGCSVMWPAGVGLRVETVLNSTIGADSETATRRAIVRAAADCARPKTPNNLAKRALPEKD